jgi:hypothetical protein
MWTQTDAGRRSHQHALDQRRSALDPSRAWYNSARWKKLRALVLAEEPTCQRCRNEPLRAFAEWDRACGASPKDLAMVKREEHATPEAYAEAAADKLIELVLRIQERASRARQKTPLSDAVTPTRASGARMAGDELGAESRAVKTRAIIGHQKRVLRQRPVEPLGFGPREIQRRSHIARAVARGEMAGEQIEPVERLKSRIGPRGRS